MIQLTAKNFDIETKGRRSPVVVMFYALWCGKCAMMKPVVAAVERRYNGRVTFCRVDVEECGALAAKYGADIVPTFIMYRDGEPESFMQGVLSEEVLAERVEELLY